MNQAKRTAKLRNIRLGLERKFLAQGARPHKVAAAVEATIAKLRGVPNLQLRRFARLLEA